MTEESDHLETKRRAPGKRISIALAIAVHLALAIFLIFGVQWQSQRPETVEVDLLRSMPTSPSAAPAPASKPEPKPEPKPQPKPEPKPEPKPAPPPPKPDIAIKEKPKPKEEKPSFDPLAQMKELLKPSPPSVSTAAEKELAQRKANEAAAASAAHSKALATWSDRIASKIKHNIVRPANASGNPEAIYEITLLPDGSIIGEPRLVQSTGNPALDSAIERAIRKSDPLPKPDDPSVFQRILRLKFRPLEE
jgi:colicin import membrane protein